MTSPEAQKDRVLIFDTTLRDGEQSPGCSMNLEEKLRMARLLDDMGVDIIEAGFPIASPGDFEAVNEIAKVIKRATVCGLSRAIERDIDVAGEALAPSQNRRIHTFISTSPQHTNSRIQALGKLKSDIVTANYARRLSAGSGTKRIMECCGAHLFAFLGNRLTANHRLNNYRRLYPIISSYISLYKLIAEVSSFRNLS